MGRNPHFLGQDMNEELKKLFSAELETQHKLTNWKNEPTVDKLMYDYQQATSDHYSQISKVDKWIKLLNPATDKSKIKKGRSGISPKIIRRLVEWRNASLTTSFLNEKNLFQVKPTAPKYLDSALQNELILNYQFNSQIGKVKFINELIRTLTAEGTVIARVGWNEEIQTKEKEIPVYQYVQADEEQTELISQILQQINQEADATGINPQESETFGSLDPIMKESLIASSEYGMPVVAIDTGHTQKVSEQVQVKNRPTIDIVNIEDLVVDPTCNGDLSKAKFVIYMYETNMSNLKASGIYKNLDKLEGNVDSLQADSIASMSDEIFNRLSSNDKPSFNFQDNPRKTLKAFEYWGYYDIDGTGIVQSIVATIVNGVMIRLERNPFPDNEVPFVIIPYMPVKKSVYGEPDAELLEDNQDIIKATMRSIVDVNARSANGQTGIPKGFLDYNNAKKFNLGEDYEYNPMGIHPAEAIYMHTSNEIPQSSLALIQSQFAEAEAATGIKAFQNGIDGNAYGQVVAGMSQAITAMTQRESDVIFRISEGLSKIGNKIIAMNAVWLNEEEVVAISDNEFIDIYRDNLKGDFSLSVDIKSNSEAEGKAQQLTFVTQTLGADADWGIRKLYMIEICRLYGLDSMAMQLQKYEPQPDPMQQELQQLEIEEKKAKIQKLNEEAEYYRKRSEFIDAQVENVQADTDQKDLDFLEQQEGVKHARQKEIVESQANAQNKGKIATELLKNKAHLDKAHLDNETKRLLGDKQNRGQSALKRGQLPRAEQGSFPEGLFRADGLGNYNRANVTAVPQQ